MRISAVIVTPSGLNTKLESLKAGLNVFIHMYVQIKPLIKQCSSCYIDRATSKRQKSHKKFRRKRSNKKSVQQQEGQSGKSKKRKQPHLHGKSKQFKRS